MIISRLILFLALFLQDEPKIFLDDNGVTLKCSVSAKIGESYIFNDQSYLVVDNELLNEMASKGQPLDNVVTTFVTDTSYLFYQKYNFNGDLSHWDVSNVTNMTFMFGFAASFNSDLSYWNTEKVKYFSDMFHGTKNFNSDISRWNISNGSHLNGMFQNSNFNSPINSWDVSNATHMSGMFDNSVHFNQPLYKWNTSEVIDMGGMFAEALNFNQDISMWNVNKVTIMENMFRNAIKFSQNLSLWTPDIIGVPNDFYTSSLLIPPKFKVVKSSIYLQIALMLILFSSFSFFSVWKFRKTTSAKSYQDIIKRLKNIAKEDKLISMKELHEIFEIHHLQFEAQKVKRASMIRQINLCKPGLIKRVRNLEDKRYFLYKIKK